ncbi:hypothetical protein [Enterococcus sp. AZ102]
MEKEVKVNVQIEGLEEALEKVEKYVELLNEAKTLAEELASLDLKINSSC